MPFILSVVIVGTATFSAGSSRPVGTRGAILPRIGRLLWDRTGLSPGGSWWGCTGLLLGDRWRDQAGVMFCGRWRARTGVFFSAHWRNRTGLFLGRRAGPIIITIPGQFHQKPSNITPILFLFHSRYHGWRGWRWKHLALMG